MGNLINPVTTRLGFTSYWTSVWTAYDPKNFLI